METATMAAATAKVMAMAMAMTAAAGCSGAMTRETRALILVLMR